jgi:leader peptidase (prepilin peptidase)/N-methyltransferase
MGGSAGEFAVLWFAVLGLLVGSFLNVVIYRLPIMLERQWAALDAPSDPTAQPFNLLVPRSSCPHCQSPIHWYQNIPLVSYLVLRGKCGVCQAPISFQYPLIEAVSTMLFAASAYHFGAGAVALLWCGFCATLLVAAVIDWKTTYLPDVLTLPLMWAGIASALLGWVPLTLSDAVWGAITGYLSLWTVFWIFKWVTGKDGMGYGDFKLLAALGAWLGPVALIPVLLISCTVGAGYGIAQRLGGQLVAGQAFAFGPFLALAGIVLCFWKMHVLQAMGLAL